MKRFPELGPKEQRGSKPRCHLFTDGTAAEVAGRLTALVEPYGSVSRSSEWRPAGFDDVDEVQLDKPNALIAGEMSRQLTTWWYAKPGGRSPTWDLASQCAFGKGSRRRQGVLLVEAKAHDKELARESGGKKLGRDASFDSRRNHDQIGTAIEEANEGLRILTGDQAWGLSRDSTYQMANRFAWGWKLKSLREALAQYALGDDGTEGEEIIVPIEERVQALIEAIEATESHLSRLGFDPAMLIGSRGFARIQGLKDAVEAVHASDDDRRRFEALAREVFKRFKALLTEPSAFTYAERHDNIEAIYKKLTERRDSADVTDVLKELHRIVNQAIRTEQPGGDQAEGVKLDLSEIDMEKLREEFAKKAHRKATALRDIREIVEAKLAEMLAQNPTRMDYQRKYEEIVADYNREKDRVTAEETFRRLAELVEELDAEQNRAVEEGLSEEELALFDMLRKDGLGKADRERVKQASRDLLASIEARLAELDRFWEKEQTKAEVQVFILDQVHMKLPTPPFTPDDLEAVAGEVYKHVWQRAVRGDFSMAA